MSQIEAAATVLSNVKPSIINLENGTGVNLGTPKKVTLAGEKKVKDPNQPKKPMNAFFLYQRDHRQELKQSFPEESPNEIAKLLSLKWSSESTQVKAKYEEEARGLLAKFKESCLNLSASNSSISMSCEDNSIEEKNKKLKVTKESENKKIKSIENQNSNTESLKLIEKEPKDTTEAKDKEANDKESKEAKDKESKEAKESKKKEKKEKKDKQV
jgi:hypothetical protein